MYHTGVRKFDVTNIKQKSSICQMIKSPMYMHTCTYVSLLFACALIPYYYGIVPLAVCMYAFIIVYNMYVDMYIRTYMYAYK